MSTSIRELVRKRDFYAGGLMVLIGIGIALKGSTYRAGTLMHMGPGFLPTALGVILALIGLAIAATALSSADGADGHDESILPAEPQWFAWACILASPALFIVCGYYFGLAPGTFACVFIAALGANGVTFKSASILSLIVTSFGVTLFVRFLQVPLPVFSTLQVAAVATYYTAAIISYFVVRPLVSSWFLALVMAAVISAAYVAGLFFQPIIATLVLAGFLTYFAFRQASLELLSTFVFEIAAPVFAAANVLYFLFSRALGVDPTKSFLLGVIGAGILALGLYLPPGVRARATGTVQSSKQGGMLAPLALACLFAIAAAVFRELWHTYPDRPLSVVAGMVPILIVTAGAILWSSLYTPAAAPAIAGGPAIADGPVPAPAGRLCRRAESPLPLALACVIMILAVFGLAMEELFSGSPMTGIIIAVVIAAMFALGAYFAPGTWTVADDPAALGERRLLPGGEAYLPYLLALVGGVLAMEVSAYLDLFSSFLQRGVT